MAKIFWTLLFVGVALLGFRFLALAVNVTSTVTTTAQAGLTQAAYRWYENTNGLTPTTARAGLNTSAEVAATGGILRLRMNLSAGAAFGSGLTFKLQFSTSSDSGYADLSTSTAWIFNDNTSVADGQTIIDTVLGDSTVGQSYGESNPSAATPNAVVSGDKAEWDWVVRNNSADTSVAWYFRMIYSSSTVLDAYDRYPTLAAAAAGSTGGTSVTLQGGGGGVVVQATSTTPRPRSPCDDVAIQQVDLSGDCKVDIVDLSILLYYYERTGPQISRYDFSDNLQVDFPDVSIMMFYWTG